MKDLIKGVAYIAAVLIVVSGARYMIGAVITNEQVRQVEQRANDPKSESIISEADAKATFMESCDTDEFSGSNFDQRNYCSCIYDKLVEHHGVNWLIQVGLNDTPEEMQTKMQPEVNFCLQAQGIEA